MTSVLVICETVAAITLHLREVTTDSPIKLGGHWPRPLALCGAEVSWDTQIPVSSVRCRGCIKVMDAKRETDAP